jgi:hypothetical protein
VSCLPMTLCVFLYQCGCRCLHYQSLPPLTYELGRIVFYLRKGQRRTPCRRHFALYRTTFNVVTSFTVESDLPSFPHMRPQHRRHRRSAINLPLTTASLRFWAAGVRLLLSRQNDMLLKAIHTLKLKQNTKRGAVFPKQGESIDSTRQPTIITKLI